MGKCVPEVRLVTLRVIVKQLGERGTVLGRVQDQDQLADVGGVLDVLLLLVEVWMDLEQRGDQGEG